MQMKKRIATLLCVAIAGLIFIPTVFFNRPLFALFGAFFDWLPLPTGWMKAQGGTNRTFMKLHLIITLVAYAVFAAWLVSGSATAGFAFLEIWWMAVIFGVLMGY